MKRVLILHGTGASPEANWFRWLEDELVARGYIVWLPQLPNAETPNTKTYNDFLLRNDAFRFNEDAVLIGHSSGAVAILNLLQHMSSGAKVGDVYLVSAFKDNLNWDALDGLFVEPYDYENIKTKASSFALLHSDNDPYIPLHHAEFLADKLNAKLIVEPGQGHFNTEQSAEYTAFPRLLELIENK